MSWLKVDEARTEGRKLTCGMLAAEFVESKYELEKRFDDRRGRYGSSGKFRRQIGLWGYESAGKSGVVRAWYHSPELETGDELSISGSGALYCY